MRHSSEDSFYPIGIVSNIAYCNFGVRKTEPIVLRGISLDGRLFYLEHMKKTVLITGASRGLGKELAKVFAENGYDLILACRQSVTLHENGHPVFTGDLSHPKTISHLAEAAKNYDIDILINNAAIYVNKPFDEITGDEIQKVIDINLVAPMKLTKFVWPVLAKKSGMIVNINSTAGQSGANGESAYCASKFGLRGFSEALQFDGTKDNVRILNVNVGAMKTNMTKGRDDWYNFIDPKEAAETIFKACCNRQSLRVSEINILRSQY